MMKHFLFSQNDTNDLLVESSTIIACSVELS